MVLYLLLGVGVVLTFTAHDALLHHAYGRRWRMSWRLALRLCGSVSVWPLFAHRYIVAFLQWKPPL